jgi:hypothetical protein
MQPMVAMMVAMPLLAFPMAVMPLQHLAGLRQLQLSAIYLLLDPSVAWLSQLTQLTLLGVFCDGLTYHHSMQYPHAAQQQQVEHCVAAVVPWVKRSCPASLGQLVLYMYGVPVREVLPSPLPVVSVYVRGEEVDAGLRAPQEGFTTRSAAVPMQPCPHLPGVWELL